MSKKLYEVISKYNGYLSVKEYNTNIVRIFPKLGFSMMLSEESIRNIAYNPGGRFILENRLIVNDPELVKELELNLELEDTYTPDDIKELIINGSKDQLEDALNFGNEGTRELIKDTAINLEINDLEKRKVIQDFTHVDVNSAINNKSEETEEHTVQATTEVKHRKAVPFKSNKPVEENKEPQYKIVDGRRVRV